jgi:twitching motility protein PilT
LKTASFQQILKKGISEKVKGIFFFPGFPPLGNRMGLVNLDKAVLTEMDIKDILASTLTEWQHDRLMKDKELDYSYELDGIARFRVAAFQKMGSIGLVMRVIPSEIPTFEALGLPDIIKDFTRLRDGLVLITGPTGSGKSTTIAALLEVINQSYGHHIITIEDPIEFVYESKRSIISQRR